MHDLQIFLFGRFQVKCTQHSLITLEARKAQELFFYLLLQPDRPHFRETLADLLWGDASAAQPKRYLSKALWQIQATLNPSVEPASKPLLLVESDWIQLNPEADYWLDVKVFEAAFTLVQNISGRDLDHTQAQTVQYAISLYAGDLLEGWYSDWCLYERERLKHMYLAMLDKLMNYYEMHQDYERGITCGTEALRHDPARERTHRRLIRLYYLNGYRTEALRQFERCAAILAKELNVKPAQKTLALYEQFRAGHVDTSSQSPGQAAFPISLHLPELLNNLQHIQVTLTNLHRQVQQNIQAVKRAIEDQQ